MSKALRLSEKWFRRGLWLVAFVFAWFLVGLGSTIVGDLPQVEQPRTLDDFLDHFAFGIEPEVRQRAPGQVFAAHIKTMPGVGTLGVMHQRNHHHITGHHFFLEGCRDRLVALGHVQAQGLFGGVPFRCQNPYPWEEISANYHYYREERK